MRQSTGIFASCKLPLLECLQTITHDLKQISIKYTMSCIRVFSCPFLKLNYDQGIAVFRVIVSRINIIFVVCTTRPDVSIPINCIEIVPLLNSRQFLFAHALFPFFTSVYQYTSKVLY